MCIGCRVVAGDDDGEMHVAVRSPRVFWRHSVREVDDMEKRELQQNTCSR